MEPRCETLRRDFHNRRRATVTSDLDNADANRFEIARPDQTSVSMPGIRRTTDSSSEVQNSNQLGCVEKNSIRQKLLCSR